jgi:hypothetical protein
MLLNKKYLILNILAVFFLAFFISTSYACNYKNLEDWGRGYRDSKYVDNEFVFRGKVLSVTQTKDLQNSDQFADYIKVLLKVKVAEEIVHKTFKEPTVTIEYTVPLLKNSKDKQNAQNYFHFEEKDVGREYLFLTTQIPSSEKYNLWTRYSFRKGKVNLKSGILGCDDFGVYNSDRISLKALRKLLHPNPNSRGMNLFSIFQL